jgi:hypothetical protein
MTQFTASLLVATCLATPVLAQASVLWSSTVTGLGFTRAFDAGRDVNADGVPDVVFKVSVPTDVVHAVSGLDGSLLLAIPTPVGGAAVTDVAMLSDIDGDGRAEIAISRAFFRDGSNVQLGRVEMYSGATGTLLHSVEGIHPGGSKGNAIFNGGDISGDGRDDLVVWQQRNSNSSVIETALLSGADLSQINLVTNGAFASFRVVPAGDPSGDGRPDLLQLGVVPGAKLIDGQSITEIGSYSSPGLIDFTTPLGDVDGDGRDDHGALAIIDPFQYTLRALVFSSATHTVLHTGPDIRYSTSFVEIGAIGDVTGDCISEYAIFGPTFPSTIGLTVYSGTDSSVVANLVTGAWSNSRYRVKSIGDVDGDGFAEVCIAHGTLIAVIDLGLSGALPSLRSIGSACAGSAGNLALSSATGCPRVGAPMSLMVRNALPTAPLVQNLGMPTNQPLDAAGMPGCTLLATGDGFHVFGTADANGTASTPGFTVPNDIALVGLQLVSQAICVDAAANAAGLTTSRGVLITIGS